MKSRALCLFLAATSGCLIVPKPYTQVRTVEFGETEIKPETPGNPVLTATGSATNLVVSTTRSRQCRRDTFDVLETTTKHEAALDGVGGGGGGTGSAEGFLLLAVLAPVTLAVSGIITGIILHGEEATKLNSRKYTNSDTFACPLPVPGVAVDLALPSGAHQTVLTDALGTAGFAIPTTEPDKGVITVSAAGVGSRRVQYFKDPAQCNSERAELFTNAATLTTDERARALRDFPACGSPSSVHERTWALMISASLSAHASDCAGAEKQARQVATLDRDQYRTLSREIGLVGCRQTGATQHAELTERRASCRKHRSELAIAAQQVSDLGERARRLQGLPVCEP